MLASKHFEIYKCILIYFLSILRNKVLAVIIDNTNIRADECRPYFQKATNYGYAVIIVEPRTNWKRDANQLMS